MPARYVHQTVVPLGSPPIALAPLSYCYTSFPLLTPRLSTRHFTYTDAPLAASASLRRPPNRQPPAIPLPGPLLSSNRRHPLRSSPVADVSTPYTLGPLTTLARRAIAKPNPPLLTITAI